MSRQVLLHASSTFKLQITVRGAQIPVLAIRKGCTYNHEIAFQTSEEGWSKAYRPLPPYEDGFSVLDRSGDTSKTYYFVVESGALVTDEHGRPSEDKEMVEIQYDFPRAPDLACHDCESREETKGQRYFRRDLTDIRLNGYGKDDGYTEEAQRYGFTDADVPEDTSEYDRRYWRFALCPECLKAREALRTLANQDKTVPVLDT